MIAVEVPAKGPAATLAFVDGRRGRAAAPASRSADVTAFPPYLRLRSAKIRITMDGIPWKRTKWSHGVRTFFWTSRDTAGGGQFPVADADGWERAMDAVLCDDAAVVAARRAARRRTKVFSWDAILAVYEAEARRRGDYPQAPAAARRTAGGVSRSPRTGVDRRSTIGTVEAGPAC